MLGPETSVFVFSADSVIVLKHYPLVQMILLQVCYQDAYAESQADGFKAIEKCILQWQTWHTIGT